MSLNSVPVSSSSVSCVLNNETVISDQDVIRARVERTFHKCQLLIYYSHVSARDEDARMLYQKACGKANKLFSLCLSISLSKRYTQAEKNNLKLALDRAMVLKDPKEKTIEVFTLICRGAEFSADGQESVFTTSKTEDIANRVYKCFFHSARNMAILTNPKSKEPLKAVIALGRGETLYRTFKIKITQVNKLAQVL